MKNLSHPTSINHKELLHNKSHLNSLPESGFNLNISQCLLCRKLKKFFIDTIRPNWEKLPNTLRITQNSGIIKKKSIMKHILIWDSKNYNINLQLEVQSFKNRFTSLEETKFMNKKQNKKKPEKLIKIPLKMISLTLKTLSYLICSSEYPKHTQSQQESSLKSSTSLKISNQKHSLTLDLALDLDH